MNDLLLNMLQPMPVEGGKALQIKTGVTAGPDSDSTEFGAVLGNLLSTGLTDGADNQLLLGLMTGEVGNEGAETPARNVMSLLSEVPLAGILNSAIPEATAATAGDSDAALRGEGTLKVIAAEFVPVSTEGEVAHVTDEDSDIERLLQSVKPTLQSYTQHADDLIDGVKPDPAQTLSLKLEFGGSSMVVPVEAPPESSGSVLELNITTDGRLALNNVDPETMAAVEAKAAIERAIPAAIQKDISDRPEVSVKQIIVVADPKKFAKDYLTDLVESESRKSDNSKSETRTDTNIRLTDSARSGIADKAPNPFTDARSSADGQRMTDQRPIASNHTSQQPEAQQQPRVDVKLDIERLVRQSTVLPDKGVPRVSLTDSMPQAVEVAVKPSIQSVAMPESTQTSTNVARSVSAEPVAFKVLLPDAQIKIADMSTFRISIQPESLGQVRVHLAVVEDQLTARLSVESAAAKSVVESNLPALRESLQQHGIKVESFAVNITDRDNPDRQYGHKREPLSRRAKDGTISMDSLDRTEAPIATKVATSAANLSGHLNLVA